MCNDLVMRKKNYTRGDNLNKLQQERYMIMIDLLQHV